MNHFDPTPQQSSSSSSFLYELFNAIYTFFVDGFAKLFIVKKDDSEVVVSSERTLAIDYHKVHSLMRDLDRADCFAKWHSTAEELDRLFLICYITMHNLTTS
jgi:hypothetical protein